MAIVRRLASDFGSEVLSPPPNLWGQAAELPHAAGRATVLPGHPLKLAADCERA